MMYDQLSGRWTLRLIIHTLRVHVVKKVSMHCFLGGSGGMLPQGNFELLRLNLVAFLLNLQNIYYFNNLNLLIQL